MRRPTSEQASRRRLAAVVVGTLGLLVALMVVARLGDDEGSEAAPRTTTSSTTDARTAPTDGEAPPATPSTTTPTGRFVTSTGIGVPVGDGLLRTYRVEVEDGTGIDPDAFADEVEVILSSEWGWTKADGISLQRVADGADIVVTLATPPTVDLLCFPLETDSQVSCAQPQRAIINLERWLLGAEPSGLDVATYRGYLISHEVGHTLGHSHVDCPGPGVPAPVMMQQTLSIGACAPNPWPVPVETAAGG